MKICAFTGHRPKSFPWKYDETTPGCVMLKKVLAEQITVLVDDGVAVCVAELQKLGQRQERYKQEKFRVYENFNDGGLTRDAYLKQRAEIDSKIAATKA